MPTYTGSRPSVRSIRAGAAPSMELPARYSRTYEDDGDPKGDHLLADPVPYKSPTRADAEAAVKIRYPQFFKSEAEIRAEMAKGGEKGTALSRGVSRAISNNRYVRDAEIDGTLKRMKAESLRQYERDRERLDPVRREQDRMNRDKIYREEQVSGIAEADAQVTRGRSFTQAPPKRFERENLNRAEAIATLQKDLNPGFSQSFAQVQDFLGELSAMDPESRKQALDELQIEANDSVDEYFNKRDEQVRTRLSERIKQLNDKFGILSDQEKFKLDSALQTLDTDTAKKLSEGMEDLFSRGAGDSGLLRTLADKIIEGRIHEAGEAEKIFEINKKMDQHDRDVGIKNAQLAADEDFFDIDQERKSERSQAFSDIMGDRIQQGLLAQILGGATELQSPMRGGGTQLLDGTRVPTPTNIESGRGLTPSTLASRAIPTINAPKGSSLEMAQAASRGELTLAEQRAARDKLLFPTSARIPTSPAPKPAQPPANTALSVRNPYSGATYTGATAARLQARLNR